MKKIVLGMLCASVLLFSGCGNSKESRTLEETQQPEATQSQETKTFVSVSAKQFKAFTDTVIKDDTKSVILDVRTLPEFQAGHIKNAIMLDFYKANFRKKLSQLDKNKTYFIYCRSGNRSGQTLDVMKRLGFKKVYNLKRGINDWKRNNFALVQ